jgi:thiol-disulfide isomerase/thioredoxin
MHYNKMFSGEIEELEQLPGFFSDVSEALDKTHSYVWANEFDEALASLDLLKGLLPGLIETIDLPVLLDFTGPKCKACKSMKTRLLSIAPDYKGKVRVVFVDANKEKDLVKKYRVMLIPTLVFFDRLGEEVDRHIGEMEDRTVRARLEELIE